jgi:hypothetical protein
LTVNIRDFRVPAGKAFKRANWPTLGKPVYKSKKTYKALLQTQVAELKSLQRLHYASNRHAVLLIFRRWTLPARTASYASWSAKDRAANRYGWRRCCPGPADSAGTNFELPDLMCVFAQTAQSRSREPRRSKVLPGAFPKSVRHWHPQGQHHAVRNDAQVRQTPHHRARPWGRGGEVKDILETIGVTQVTVQTGISNN